MGITGASGLVVEVPEAEPVVAHHRATLDEHARLGVPAHVTVLFPFMPPERIDEAVLTELRGLFAASTGFESTFARTAWFDDDVLWLAPEDPEPFRELTRKVEKAFPEFPPYDGGHPDPDPHLTVAYRSPVGAMKQAECSIVPRLPVTTRVGTVSLLTQTQPGGCWSRADRFPLGRPHGDAT